MKYDVVVVGAGIAGLYCALHLPKHLKVLLLCKQNVCECNTFYAQGGISVALDEEDTQHHIEDTLSAGSFLNNHQRVATLSSESLKVIADLEKFGIFADKNEQGEILYAREGGHKKARIIHFNGDGSGEFVHTHLLRLLPHCLQQNSQVIDLIIDNQQCSGVVVEQEGEIYPIYANCVVLASGGIGGLYTYHTNAKTLSADLHGIILEKGLSLKDMEMIQFHPTTYTQAPMARKPLISEAVRGEGGKIVDLHGRRFLFDYDARGELAPRDIVSRAIFDYCKTHHQEAFLDLSCFSETHFKQRFPNIYQSLRSFHLAIPQERIPISPAFHYCMGGIEVDERSQVVGIERLYAIGECANNGIHGANRLASNSLLEGLVFGKRVAEEILHSNFQSIYFHLSSCQYEEIHCQNDDRLKNQLRAIMWDKVGIIRTQEGLCSALQEIELMSQEKMGRMLKLRIRVAKEMIIQALRRKESLGAHFLQD